MRVLFSNPGSEPEPEIDLQPLIAESIKFINQKLPDVEQRDFLTRLEIAMKLLSTKEILQYRDAIDENAAKRNRQSECSA